MSENLNQSTLRVVTDNPSNSSIFEIEYEMTIMTSQYRSAQRADTIPRVKLLKTLYSELTVQKVECEVRQCNLVGIEPGELDPKGHIFVALIPSNMNTDAATGNLPAIVSSVPRKQTFPLSKTNQNVNTFVMNLVGYEVDLGQDPRKGQGIVLWCGNSGVAAADDSGNLDVCSVTWRLQVAASGVSNLWA